MLVYDQYIYPEKPDSDDDIIVLHSGFSSTSSNYSFGKDTRDYYLIHYVTNGKGVYQTSSQKYNLKQGDGFLILPDETIVHTADKYDPWDLCWVAFSGKKADTLLADAGLDENHLIFHYDSDDYLETCIKNIYNESRGSQNLLYITGYFYMLLGRLSENHQKRHHHSLEKAQFTRFQEAMNLIHRNIHQQISVGYLANCMRLDTSQVYRIFKKHTGKSPQQVISDLRIEKSCEFLTMTDLPVKDISEWMGYEYPSHFTKQFKAKMHMSPSQYRALHIPHEEN